MLLKKYVSCMQAIMYNGLPTDPQLLQDVLLYKGATQGTMPRLLLPGTQSF